MQQQLTMEQWAKACINVLIMDFYFTPSQANLYFNMHPDLGPYEWEDGITPFEAVLESL